MVGISRFPSGNPILRTIRERSIDPLRREDEMGVEHRWSIKLKWSRNRCGFGEFLWSAD